MADLVERYEKSLSIWLHENGFPQPPLMAMHHDGQVSMATMAIPQAMIFDVAMDRFMTDISVKEIIFGVDHYTKPGQGTKYKSVLTVFWWQGERTEDLGFRFGVVNYRPPPRQIIEPINWNNAFWNDIMGKIVQSHYEGIKQRIAKMRQAGHGNMIDDAAQAINEMREHYMRGQKLS